MKKPATLGECVRMARINLDLTQVELATAMGLGLSGQVTVSQIERDQRRPRPEMLSRLATALYLESGHLAHLAAMAYERELLERLRSSS